MTSRPPAPLEEAAAEDHDEAEAKRAERLARVRKRWKRRRAGTAGFLALLIVILLAGLSVRFGVRTDAGRAMVARLFDGREIGRGGRLHVEGLRGDVFGEFSVDRLSIADAKGAWVEARDVGMRWAPVELIARRFHAEQIRAGVVRVLRRPELGPAGPGGGGPSPVRVVIDELKLRLETLPAFSVRPGAWDMAGQADVRRNGEASGRLDAQSRIHAGDGLAVLFHFASKGRMTVRVDAVEAAGGAFAGSLGLPSAQRFLVHGRVDGSAEHAGTLSLVAESGQRRPITANGTWSPGGFSLEARTMLDASTLTSGYAARIGPEARLTLSARPLAGDRFQVDAAVRGRDASLSVKGPIDWRRRQTAGLSLDLAVNDLHRWVSDLGAGPSRANGTLSGSLDRWRFQGRAELARIDQWGYRLARAAGPAALAYDRQEIRLQTDLATAGGAGEGLLPFLLGAAPRIRIDSSRLAGGRYLIRDLGLAGAALTLKATGDRSPLGALSLKGDLTLSRLEGAHAGAKGLVKAAWTARQSLRSPWSIAADAHGEGLATGFAEVDRLLGAKPQLTVDALWGPQGLTLSRAQINGEAAQAGVRGTVSPAAMLALDVDWRARGPFEVGPVEVAGQAVGTGKVTGRALAPAVDLAADLASIDFGALAVRPAHLALQLATENGPSGHLALTGGSDWGPAAARARFRFLSDGIELSEIDADAGGAKAMGALALRDGAPSSADLTFAVAPGAFLAQGRLAGTMKIQERPGGAVAQIALDGQRLVGRGVAAGPANLRLRAAGPFARLPFQVSADAEQPFAWRFAGDGLLVQTGAGAAVVREVSLSGQGRVRQADVRTIEPADIRIGPGGEGVKLRLAVGPGRVDLDASQAGETMRAEGRVAGVELASLVNGYTGRVSGALSLNGRGAQLTGSADAAVEGGRDRDAPADVGLSAKLHAELAGQALRLTGSATNPQGLTAKLDLTAPAEASAAPFRVALVRNRPLSGDFTAQGELRPLWDLFAGGARTLSGRGAVQARLGGTLNAFRPTGQASIEQGRFQDSGSGLDLRNLDAQADFDSLSINVRRFTGDDGRGGQLSGAGELSFAPEGASTFRLNLRGFRLIDNEIARASASGQVTVTRDAAGKARLSGALTVDRADITAKPPTPSGVTPLDVVEIHKPSGDGEADADRRGAGGPDLALDVSVRSARGVLIRGNGLDLELSLDAHVGGTVTFPDLSGVARVVRGDYQFAGKRFEFEDGGTVRLASRPEAIRLDLTATRDDPTLTARVQIRGTAAKPLITLSSTPVLPQDEILSQVLFGRSASQLSALEAAQLASAVSGLASGGGLDVLGGLRQFARLDRLAVSGGSGGTAATVSGGKYLTDDVYLELTGGGRTGPSAQVEWRVRRNLSIVSTVGTQRDAHLAIRFRRNY